MCSADDEMAQKLHGSPLTGFMRMMTVVSLTDNPVDPQVHVGRMELDK